MTSLVICIASVLAGAETPVAADPGLRDEVARLVASLGARELGRRDDAERKLLSMGAAVLPLLPAVNDRTPAEVAQRLARIQQKLLIAQASAAAEPTVVTLHERDLSLAEALAAIAEQTGNPVIDHRSAFGEEQSDTKVRADFDKIPFWRALDNVLDQAGLTLYGFAGKRGAFVVNRPPSNAPRAQRAVYAGPFRLEPLRFEAMRDLRNEDAHALKFFLEVTWEPRLQPIAILQPLSEVKAIGGDGRPIEVTDAEAAPEAPINDGISAAELEIPLALPARTTEKIGSIKGRLLAMVAGPTRDFRFSQLAAAAGKGKVERAEQRQAGATVSIDQVRKNNELWEVSLRVKFDEPSAALESHRGWILENEAFFQNAAGERFEPGGFEQTRQSRDEVGINYYFDLKQGPEKLDFVYRTPITILELKVDYEFRDLRLP